MCKMPPMVPRVVVAGDGGGSYVREVFPDTAYWNATVETDEEGHATVSVVLPDSLTTWHFAG